MSEFEDLLKKLKPILETWRTASDQDIYWLVKEGEKLPNNSQVLEIGSGLGLSMICFASGAKDKNIQFTTIDPFDVYINVCQDGRKQKIDQVNIEHFKANIKQCGINVDIIRAKSDDVVNKFKDNFFDLIYIDGSHKYSDVKNDLINYTPKVKEGGILLGHDYSPIYPQVQKAVDEVFGQKIERLKESSLYRTKRTIPIFIITCDRLEVLGKSIQSYYDNIKTPFEIIIVDFGSTYEPTLKFLKYQERKKIKIYWKERITSVTDLNRVDEAVQDYFKNHPKSNYVVTDPDIALDNTDGDILNIYSRLLERIPEILAVGPMLRIDDIPDCYPQKEKVNVAAGWHIDFHFKRKVNAISCGNKTIRYILAPIDTTFGMSRAGTHWGRYREAARVLSPYSARHLDWYLDPKNLTQDQEYYREHASKKIAHWSMWED